MSRSRGGAAVRTALERGGQAFVDPGALVDLSVKPKTCALLLAKVGETR